MWVRKTSTRVEIKGGFWLTLREWASWVFCFLNSISWRSFHSKIYLCSTWYFTGLLTDLFQFSCWPFKNGRHSVRRGWSHSRTWGESFMVVSMLREDEVVPSSSRSSHQLKNNYSNRADHHFQSTSCQTPLSPSPSAPQWGKGARVASPSEKGDKGATFFIRIFPVGFPTGVLYFNDKFSPQRHTQHQVFWGFTSEYV